MSSDFVAIPVKPIEYITLDSSLKFVFRGLDDGSDEKCDRIFTKADEQFLRGLLAGIKNRVTRQSMEELIEMICKSESGYRLKETWL